MSRYTLTMFTHDMGSFKQPGCKASATETLKENALWSVNSARDHDGLRHLTLEEFEDLFDNDGKGRWSTTGWAKFTEETV